MTVIYCVANDLGISFGGRRVSRDSMVCSDILQLAEGRPLYMAPTSAKLFAGLSGEETIVIGDTPPDGDGDIYFYESGPQEPLSCASRLIIYRWNRDYPSDVKLEADLSGYELKDTYEFQGKSHELITREIYERKA